MNGYDSVAFYFVIGALVSIAIARLALYVARGESLVRRGAGRRANMAALAGQFGLQFSPGDPSDIAHHYGGFGWLFGDGSREIYNVIYGRLGDCEVKAFDCRLAKPELEARGIEGPATAVGQFAGLGDDTLQLPWYLRALRRDSSSERIAAFQVTAVVLDSDIFFKPIFIRPEGSADWLAKAITRDDITFESEEFNRRFYIQAADRKFAYALLSPRVMQLLLANPARHVDLFARSVVVYDTGMLSVRDVRRMIEFAQRFVELVPEYLRQGLQES